MDYLNKEQLNKLLQSPESKNILTFMKSTNQDALNQIIHNIKCGNIDKAEQQIRSTFHTTEMKKQANDLLHKLG